MMPKRLCAPPEVEKNVDIEAVERVLSTDYKISGSADKAIQKLRELLANLKKE